MGQLTIEDVLNRAVNVEKIAESFYRMASKRFEGTEMQMLLLQLAEEEEGHQDDVDDIKNKYQSDLALNMTVEIDGETRFLDKFEEIAEKPLAEQKEIMRGFLEKWQNGALQRDDITVMGLKM